MNPSIAVNETDPKGTVLPLLSASDALTLYGPSSSGIKRMSATRDAFASSPERLNDSEPPSKDPSIPLIMLYDSPEADRAAHGLPTWSLVSDSMSFSALAPSVSA